MVFEKIFFMLYFFQEIRKHLKEKRPTFLVSTTTESVSTDSVNNPMFTESTLKINEINEFLTNESTTEVDEAINKNFTSKQTFVENTTSFIEGINPFSFQFITII